LKGGRRRRISVEVHRIYSPSESHPTFPKSDTRPAFDECVIRILVPAPGNALSGSVSTVTRGHGSKLDEYDNDESTVMPSDFLDDGSERFANADDHDQRDWKAKYRFPIKALTITNTHKSTVSLDILLGSAKQHREIIFETDTDAREFAQIIQAQLDQEPSRAAERLRVTASGVAYSAEETITFLVEICSARSLLAGDKWTSDPFVVAYYDGKEVHRTDHISKRYAVVE
jgi:hypothetical protein